MASKIRAWLRQIGLEQYAESFEKNDLDPMLAADLNDQDLKDLGVQSMGHRKILLRTIASLNQDGRPLPDAPAGASPKETAGQGAQDHISTDGSQVERRQLTVVFCDLVGSTEMSNRIDPETYRGLIRAYQDACTRLTKRYDGYLAKYMGDGVLAYFGWPRGHEDDTELAVKAALDIITEVRGILVPGSEQEYLGIRVGIATGPVLVGDIVGEGVAREATVTGAIPNLAARLQSVAEPNTIVIDATSHAVLGGLFDFARLAPQSLKGFDNDIEAWRVVGTVSAESRFEAARSQFLTPCVGRNNELGLLRERWRQSVQGEGQLVLLSGEAGIGKSRLTHELLTGLTGAPHLRQRFQCSPYHTNSALNPFTTYLERSADFSPDDDDASKLGKLEAMLCRYGEASEHSIALMAGLLSLPYQKRIAEIDLTPRQIKQRTLEELVEHTVGQAATRPVLFIFEDAHWVDPTSLELLELIVARASGMSVLIIITHRSDWQPPLFAGANTTSLRLNRLDRSQIAEIVEAIAARAVPSDVMERLVSRADGVPLFVEEMTHSVLEGGWRTAAGAGEIPSTLQASLTARLDRLTRPAREIAQVASVIGREVSLPLLRRVLGFDTNEAVAPIDDLLESQLLAKGRSAGDEAIVFRHALIRDGAYQSLLVTRRREIHRAVADALEREFPGTVESQPELLAQHFVEADNPVAAVKYWVQAGDRAAHLVANHEAIDHYRNALEQFERIPVDERSTRREVEILLALGVPLIGATGYASDEVRDNYTRARELSLDLGDDILFAATRGLWNCIYDRGDLDLALTLAGSLVNLAESENRAADVMLAQRALGSTQKSRGMLADAVTAFETCITTAANVSLSAAIRDHGEAPQIIARQYLGWTECLLGNLDRGLALVREAVELARRLNHPIALDFALHTLAIAHLFRREYVDCREVAREMSALSEEHGFVFWNAGAKLLLGCSLTHTGQADHGLTMAAAGIRDWRATGAYLHVPTWTSFLADAALSAGTISSQASAIDDGIDMARANHDLIALAELQRLQAQVAVQEGDVDRGVDGLRGAIATSREQGALLYEMRASNDLARLMMERGAGEQAAKLLAPLYDRFNEGFDCADLQEARSLLDTLGDQAKRVSR